MLEKYDEMVFKAVTYPIVNALYEAADELSVIEAKEDCEDNCASLLNWMDKIEAVNNYAHQRIEDYIASLGYHVTEQQLPD